MAIAYADEYSKTLGYKKSNMRFLTGHIEYLDQAGIADGSVDLIISNCVINLSPDKEQVLREAYRVLAAGGEMYFSDVYSDRRVPEEAKKNEVCSNILSWCIPFTCRCGLWLVPWFVKEEGIIRITSYVVREQTTLISVLVCIILMQASFPH